MSAQSADTLQWQRKFEAKQRAIKTWYEASLASGELPLLSHILQSSHSNERRTSEQLCWSSRKTKLTLSHRQLTTCVSGRVRLMKNLDMFGLKVQCRTRRTVGRVDTMGNDCPFSWHAKCKMLSTDMKFKFESSCLICMLGKYRAK